MSREGHNLVNGVFIPNSLSVLYTSPVNQITTISACSITNESSSAVTVTMRLIKNGGTLTGNAIMINRTLAGYETFNIGSGIGQILESLGTIQASASTAGVIGCLISGVVAS